MNIYTSIVKHFLSMNLVFKIVHLFGNVKDKCSRQHLFKLLCWFLTTDIFSKLGKLKIFFLIILFMSYSFVQFVSKKI